MMKWHLLIVSIVIPLAMILHPSFSLALPVVLYNTGVDSNGLALPNDTIGDPHYTLASVPGGSTDIRVRAQAGSGWSWYPYIADSTSSAWIGANNDGTNAGPPGLYDFRTTFSLTGFDLSSVTINGRWASDNAGVDILLNGHSLGFSIPSYDSLGYSFEAFRSFSILQGNPYFIEGVNVLDFIVNNEGPNTNHMALRVEMLGTGEQTPVPEPSTVLLLSFGLAGLALIRKKFCMQ
jgi:hypothetical protein